MDFTIDTPEMSIVLPDAWGAADARRSLAELAHYARSLGALSANATYYAESVTQDYQAALFPSGSSNREAWRRLVRSVDGLLETADALDALDSLSSDESAARTFFHQIVDENRDLLDAPVLAA
jgi:hypothetical protein